VPRGDLDLEALKNWANERLGKQQRLADCVAVSALPRNPNGKILKRELRREHAERSYD
jgi:acyl-coenzyme A synthetase/AMP-(fatty) acid ligase